MKIISYNVNGIRAAISKGFIEWLKSANPDVICLQEIKATEDQIANLRSSKSLKQDQLTNKITQLQQKLTGERSELDAAGNEYNLVKDQFERNQKMFKEGLISQTTFQQRNASMHSRASKSGDRYYALAPSVGYKSDEFNDTYVKATTQLSSHPTRLTRRGRPALRRTVQTTRKANT